MKNNNGKWHWSPQFTATKYQMFFFSIIFSINQWIGLNFNKVPIIGTELQEKPYTNSVICIGIFLLWLYFFISLILRAINESANNDIDFENYNNSFQKLESLNIDLQRNINDISGQMHKSIFPKYANLENALRDINPLESDLRINLIINETINLTNEVKILSKNIKDADQTDNIKILEKYINDLNYKIENIRDYHGNMKNYSKDLDSASKNCTEVLQKSRENQNILVKRFKEMNEENLAIINSVSDVVRKISTIKALFSLERNFMRFHLPLLTSLALVLSTYFAPDQSCFTYFLKG